MIDKAKIIEILKSNCYKGQLGNSTIYEFGEFDIEKSAEKIILLLGFDASGFTYAETGEKLRCTSVYKQSKKYTVGSTYEILGQRLSWNGRPIIGIRDDKGKLTWIDKANGVSFTDFILVK